MVNEDIHIKWFSCFNINFKVGFDMTNDQYLRILRILSEQYFRSIFHSNWTNLCEVSWSFIRAPLDLLIIVFCNFFFHKLLYILLNYIMRYFIIYDIVSYYMILFIIILFYMIYYLFTCCCIIFIICFPFYGFFF